MEENKFDKNTIIGFLLIGAIMLWYMYTNQPEVDPNAEQVQNTESVTEEIVEETVTEVAVLEELTIDSSELENRYGSFASAMEVAGNTLEETTVESDLLKLTFSNKGAFLSRAELTQYKKFDGEKLVLIQNENADFNIAFTDSENRLLNTRDLYFTPTVSKSGNSTFISMKLTLGADKFIEYLYELKKDNYMLGFSVKSQGIKTLVNASQTPELSMSLNGYRQEKSIEYENQQSALHFQLKDGDSDYLSVAGEDDEQEENINWIGFKQHFFSTILIADDAFEKGDMVSESLFEDAETDSIFTKAYAFEAPLELKAGEFDSNFNYYIGPNDYELLKNYDIGIENIIDLGWGIFGTINRLAFIPLFNLLSGSIANFGLIIILMTIIP
jgi:YidC/Oxa1 family membrane protein insertase